MLIRMLSNIPLHPSVMVVLDRDDTLCVDFNGMNGDSECILLPGVIEGLIELKIINPVLAIATNQSYIGRKQLSESDVDAFHEKLCNILNLEGININIIAICPHTPFNNCTCRKPNPGMLLELIRLSGVSRREDIFVLGDKVSDMQAARAAGINGMLVENDNFFELCIKIKDSIVKFSPHIGKVVGDVESD